MNANLEIFLLLATAATWSVAAADECNLRGNSTDVVAADERLAGEAVHSRQKRYIVFPKGSSIQLVYCNTYLFKPVVDIFRMGMTAGLAWMLPSEPSDIKNRRKHRIFRRSVFRKLEAVIQTRGANGKHCILRALCESGQRRTSSKKPFVTEILHRIFSMDDEDEDGEEEHEDRIYRRAHRSVNRNCEQLYPECGFSMFDLIE